MTKKKEINVVKTKRQIAKEKAKASASKLKKETQKAIVTAITAAFGFVIALVWKDVIVEYVDSLTKASPIQGPLISALIVTIIGVIGIIIVSKLSVK